MNALSVFNSAWSGYVATALFLILSSGCSAPHERTGPYDTVESGRLCVPESSECQSEVILTRNSIGANVLDFRLTNRGERTARVSISIDSEGLPYTPDSTGTTDGSDVDVGNIDIPGQRFLLAPGETVQQRLGRRELFNRRSLSIGLECKECDVEMSYTFLSAPLECRGDDDCSGDWVCLVDRGECAECASDSDCNGDRTCSEIDNQCLPSEVGGCSTSGGAEPLLFSVLMVLLLLGGLRHLPLRRLFLGGLIWLMVGWPAQSIEAANYGASMDFGGGTRFLTGELSRNTKRGLGMAIEQTFRTERWGVSASYSLEYFLTTQQPPPLSRQLRMFSFGLAPNVYFDVDLLELSVGPVYRRLGIFSNTLVRQIGSDNNYHGLGGRVGVNYPFSQFYLQLSGEFLPVRGLPGSLVGVNLSFGFVSSDF